MKGNIGILFVIFLIGGCISQPPASQPPVSEMPVSEEVTVLDVESAIDYYSLEGYTGVAGEGFYVIAGDSGEVKKTLAEIIVRQGAITTTFARGDNLSLVVFRGVFGTGGHGIKIDKVERAGGTFVVHATYTDPGRGMMVTQAFTQPTAIIPIGKLPDGSYEAKLKVTKILKGEEGDKVLEESEGREDIAFRVK